MGADGIKRISNSELRAFKTCRRNWYLGHVRKLKRRRYNLVGPAQLGTRVHSALEAYYGLEGQSGRQAAMKSLDDQLHFELEAAPDQMDDILKEHELAAIMIEGYCNWLEETGADMDLEVIEAEQVLESESPVDGVHLIGKQDLVVQKRSTGDRGFMDHKTVTSFGQMTGTLGLDEQARMYALMRQLLDPQGAPMRFQTWNMLKKVKQTSRAKPPFYERAEIYINDPELRSFWDRLYGEITDLVRVEEQLAAGADHHVVAYPTPTRDCSWRCPFFDVCAMLDDENSDAEYLLESMYEAGNPLERYGEKIDTLDEESV